MWLQGQSQSVLRGQWSITLCLYFNVYVKKIFTILCVNDKKLKQTFFCVNIFKDNDLMLLICTSHAK